MATEVLLPQDLLAERFNGHSASFHRRRVSPASNGDLTSLVPNRKQYRKTSPPPKPEKKRSNANRSSHHHHGSSPPANTAHVTLLRRGESLSSIAGGNPINAPADIYAGSAFYMSPSPRFVPLPSFFSKNDGASRDLRRLLRLE